MRKTCPVCAFSITKKAKACTNCGWVFKYLKPPPKPKNEEETKNAKAGTNRGLFKYLKPPPKSKKGVKTSTDDNKKLKKARKGNLKKVKVLKPESESKKARKGELKKSRKADFTNKTTPQQGKGKGKLIAVGLLILCILFLILYEKLKYQKQIIKSQQHQLEGAQKTSNTEKLGLILPKVEPELAIKGDEESREAEQRRTEEIERIIQQEKRRLIILKKEPKKEPKSELQSPNLFIVNYFTQVTHKEPRQYEHTWSMLSSNFQRKHNFGSYKKWWNKVKKVEVLKAETLASDDQTASVKVKLRYLMKNGRIADETHIFKLITETTSNRWLIDKENK